MKAPTTLTASTADALVDVLRNDDRLAGKWVKVATALHGEGVTSAFLLSKKNEARTEFVSYLKSNVIVRSLSDSDQALHARSTADIRNDRSMSEAKRDILVAKKMDIVRTIGKKLDKIIKHIAAFEASKETKASVTRVKKSPSERAAEFCTEAEEFCNKLEAPKFDVVRYLALIREARNIARAGK